jgi:hypothetical protein
MWDLGTDRPAGGPTGPTWLPLPWRGVLWSPLEHSHVGFTAELHNYL